jgi:hypothetical protein
MNERKLRPGLPAQGHFLQIESILPDHRALDDADHGFLG